MKIKNIEATCLYSPDINENASDSAQDTVVIEVHSDEGITGIGEVDATPSVIKTYVDMPSSHDISMSVKKLVIGENPLDIERIWRKLYQRTLMAGRRGIGVNVIGAIDMALWDLAGKFYGQPVWRLLGGLQKEYAMPYASLPTLQDPDDIQEDILRRQVSFARSKGYRAIKFEELVNSRKRDFDAAKLAREVAGRGIDLMLDAYYCWPDFRTASSAIRDLEQFDPYFVETPLPVDDLEGLQRLSLASRTRIASGELLTTIHEFVELIDRGKVDVAQPDIGRVGGLSEARRIADYARLKGVSVIPHCWKTGISTAASLHFCLATANCPYFESLVKELAPSYLRSRLLKKDHEPVDGKIMPPGEPGLGIELDYGIMEECRR
ncbi:MAG: mandelate racemase/muconate lactonizing enzyme family protein [Thermoplasmata archaeon]|nr:mandelate racemase/muconate lactonizing enzyme family protein [Candidatus Sysuiplasma jiujiangense]